METLFSRQNTVLLLSLLWVREQSRNKTAKRRQFGVRDIFRNRKAKGYYHLIK